MNINNTNYDKNQRFIPFVGGALLGGVIGSTYNRPVVYPVYPYYPNNYYPYYPYYPYRRNIRINNFYGIRNKAIR